MLFTFPAKEMKTQAANISGRLRFCWVAWQPRNFKLFFAKENGKWREEEQEESKCKLSAKGRHANKKREIATHGIFRSVFVGFHFCFSVVVWN